MRKKSLLALLLVLVMILSGCALDVVDEAKDSARTVVDVNGTTITKGQVAQALNSETELYNSWYQYYTYYMYGQIDYSTYAFYCQYYFGVDPAEGMQEPTAESVIQEYVELLAARDKAIELGFDKLTDEQTAEIKENAKASYDAFIQSVITENFADTELEGEALIAEAEKFVQENAEKYEGVSSTLEAFEQAALDTESTLDKAVTRLQNSVVDAVTVTEEELLAEYESHVASAKASYTVDEETAAANQAAVEEASKALEEAKAALEAAAEDADKTALQSAVDAAQDKLDDAEEAVRTAAENAVAAYEQALNNGSTVYFNLPGYRKISEILIPFSDDDPEAAAAQTALTEANTALTDAQAALEAAAEDADKTELQAAVDAAQAKVDEAQAAYDAANAAANALTEATAALTDAQAALEAAAEDADKTELQAAVDAAQAKVDEAQAAVDAKKAAAKEAVLAKAKEVYELAIADGADFDALIKEYNQDGSDDGVFYVSADSVSFVADFVKAAMGIANIGEISEPTESVYGYHIVKYLEDVPEGAVTLDSVRDTLNSHVLSEKQQQTLKDAIAQWVSEATVMTYPEKMK